MLLLVNALGELFDHLPIEGRDVVWLATGDEALIGDYFAIDPLGAGVFEISA